MASQVHSVTTKVLQRNEEKKRRTGEGMKSVIVTGPGEDDDDSEAEERLDNIIKNVTSVWGKVLLHGELKSRRCLQCSPDCSISPELYLERRNLVELSFRPIYGISMATDC